MVGGVGFQAVIVFILLISNFLLQEKEKEESSVQTAELAKNKGAAKSK